MSGTARTPACRQVAAAYAQQAVARLPGDKILRIVDAIKTQAARPPATASSSAPRMRVLHADFNPDNPLAGLSTSVQRAMANSTPEELKALVHRAKQCVQVGNATPTQVVLASASAFQLATMVTVCICKADVASPGSKDLLLGLNLAAREILAGASPSNLSSIVEGCTAKVRGGKFTPTQGKIAFSSAEELTAMVAACKVWKSSQTAPAVPDAGAPAPDSTIMVDPAPGGGAPAPDPAPALAPAPALPMEDPAEGKPVPLDQLTLRDMYAPEQLRKGLLDAVMLLRPQDRANRASYLCKGKKGPRGKVYLAMRKLLKFLTIRYLAPIWQPPRPKFFAHVRGLVLEYLAELVPDAQYDSKKIHKCMRVDMYAREEHAVGLPKHNKKKTDARNAKGFGSASATSTLSSDPSGASAVAGPESSNADDEHAVLTDLLDEFSSFSDTSASLLRSESNSSTQSLVDLTASVLSPASDPMPDVLSRASSGFAASTPSRSSTDSASNSPMVDRTSSAASTPDHLAQVPVTFIDARPTDSRGFRHCELSSAFDALPDLVSEVTFLVFFYYFTQSHNPINLINRMTKRRDPAVTT